MRAINASWLIEEIGSAKVVFLRPTPWMEAVVAVDNLALGPAVGGVRLTPTVGPAEVVRLARAMTLKNAAAGLPFGGGKAGIMLAPSMDSPSHDREMRAFAKAIEPLTDYIPGPDMGTDESCMAVIHDEIASLIPDPPTGRGAVQDVALGHMTKQRWNAADQWVRSAKVTHEPLVTPDEFEQAQEIRVGRGREPTSHKPHTTRRPYALRGVLFCGYCNRRMQATGTTGSPTTGVVPRWKLAPAPGGTRGTW